MLGSVPSVYVHVCVRVCACARVCTTGSGWWRVASCSHTLLCKMSNPSSDEDQTARLWPLDFFHPLPTHPIVNLDPDVVRTAFGRRTGRTPFSISFKIGSEPVSIQPCFSESFDLCPCKCVN